MITETPTRKRGRPTTYREEAFLNQSCDLFWKHGYDAVAFDRLVNETKVTRRALYSRFESKDALLKEVLKHYLGTLFTEVDSLPTDGMGPGAVLNAMGCKLMEITTDCNGRGCLLTNTVVLGNPPEWTRPLYQEAISGFEQLLVRKQVEAGADETHAAHVARMMAIAINGLSLRARGGEALDVLKQDVANFCHLFYPEENFNEQSLTTRAS